MSSSPTDFGLKEFRYNSVNLVEELLTQGCTQQEVLRYGGKEHGLSCGSFVNF